MPLTVNVGLSRKASKDFQSAGRSINITAELDQTLLAKPEQLLGAIDRLYEQAEAALDRQGDAPGAPANTAKQPTRGNGTPGAASATGNPGTNPARRTPGATASQRKAIAAIARRLGLDVEQECRDELGAELADLDVRGASRFIDHLKALQGAGNGRGGRR